MLRTPQLPQPPVRIETLGLVGGLDLVTSPSLAKPGMARACVNYETSFNGGFQRLGGYERFDGRPRPSDATYTVLTAAEAWLSVVAGDTAVGAVSGATGKVIAVASPLLVITKVVGLFEVGETVNVSALAVGVVGALDAPTDAYDNNVYSAAAAQVYRLDIAAVPGSGPIRGVATLGSRVYAWRDTVDGLAGAIYQDSPTGWTVVPMGYEYRFNGGGTAYVAGGTLTQGGVTATIRRVMLESGLWGGSAAGRLITDAPSGNFVNGAAVGTGSCTLISVAATSALAQITLLPGGRVETDLWNYFGSSGTQRLYGCDGVNPEFEFDGTTWAPINTGMTTRAKFVRGHKNYLFYAFKGSVQHSAAGNPYSFSAVVGAGEIGTGDEVTGMSTTAGSEDSAAMLITCSNSAHVLYGTGPSTWNLVTLSRNAGANAYSVQDAGVAIGHDPQGFRLFQPTQAFGNFAWDLVSRPIDPAVRGRVPVCSVFSTKLSRYRCFFASGDVVSGTPTGKGVAWTQLQYDRAFVVAHEGEIDGVPRVFYGGPDGFVYEADVGRSFDGQSIQAALKLITMNIGSPMLIKQFRAADVEITSEGAFALSASAEFDDGSAEVESTNQQRFDALFQQQFRLVGDGGFWDVSGWDSARWDAAGEHRQRLEFVGRGYGISPIFHSLSGNELPHTIKSIAVVYSPRNLKRS